MRYLASYLTPAGALLLLVCFFLPWLVIDCQPRYGEGAEVTIEIPQQQLAEFSGLDLARARSLFWGIPISALLVVFFAASRLPIRWRYRFCLISAFGGLVLLAISYENFQRVDQAHLMALLQQDGNSEKLLGELPDGLRELIDESIAEFDTWRGTAGVEIAVDFRQAYSLAWAGCVLSVCSALVMLLRLSKRRQTSHPDV